MVAHCVLRVVHAHGKPEVCERALACALIKEEVRGLDITMNDATCMNVAQCAEEAAEVSLDTVDGERLVVVLGPIMSILQSKKSARIRTLKSSLR